MMIFLLIYAAINIFLIGGLVVQYFKDDDDVYQEFYDPYSD